MRKLAIKILSLIVAVTAVFGFVNLNTNVVGATETSESSGIWMEQGASVRYVTSSEDLSGIRFTAYLSQDKYDAIAKVDENEGKFLYVGIEVAPDGSTPIDICYSAKVIGSGDANATVGAPDNIVSAIKFNNEEKYTFYGSLTFNTAALIFSANGVGQTA
jgi:hypothetical protein